MVMYMYMYMCNDPVLTLARRSSLDVEIACHVVLHTNKQECISCYDLVSLAPNGHEGWSSACFTVECVDDFEIIANVQI